MITENKEEERVIIGAYHDILGFDLNYNGVILGSDCIKYDNDGRIVIGKGSENKELDMIENEIGVLLSRGARGLCIYAEDPAYRKALIKAIKPDAVLP